MKTAPKALIKLQAMRASVISSFIPIEGDEESYEIDDSLPNPQKEIITGYPDATSPRKRRRSSWILNQQAGNG